MLAGELPARCVCMCRCVCKGQHVQKVNKLMVDKVHHSGCEMSYCIIITSLSLYAK